MGRCTRLVSGLESYMLQNLTIAQPSVRHWILYGTSNCYGHTYRVILSTSNRTTVHAKPYFVKCHRIDVL
jgi:hypothetical protein